jgi:hypothetical protein
VKEDVTGAAPVRQHVKMLMYRGMSYTQVSRASNVPRATVVGLMVSDPQRCWGSIGRDSAQQLLAIPLPDRGAIEPTREEPCPDIPAAATTDMVLVDDATLRAARLTAACYATDADDLRLLLAVLGCGGTIR